MKEGIMNRYAKAWAMALILFCALPGCSDDDPALPTGGGDDPGGDDPPVTGLLADNTCTGAFTSIPAQALADAAANLRLFYGHTSHRQQTTPSITQYFHGTIIQDQFTLQLQVPCQPLFASHQRRLFRLQVSTYFTTTVHLG